MTVSELIEQLKNYPGDTRVLTLGYEGGLEDIQVKRDNIVFDHHDTKKTWWYGPHEYARHLTDDDTDVIGVECVIIEEGAKH